MDYIITPYAVAQIVTAFISLIVAMVLWQRRLDRGVMALILLFLALAEWSFFNALESAATSTQLKVFWSQWTYIGVQTSPVFLFIFSMNYSGKSKYLDAFKIGLLLIIPTVIIILAATNANHHLIWTSFTPGPAGTNSIIYNHGPIFWIGIVYIFTLVAISTTLLVMSSVRTQKVYRSQRLITIFAALLPWIGSFMYITGLNPFPGLDITSISFLFTGLLLLFGVFRVDFLNYVPIAHELLFENIEDGVIVLNEKRMVIDMNPSAERILGLNFSQMIKN